MTWMSGTSPAMTKPQRLSLGVRLSDAHEVGSTTRPMYAGLRRGARARARRREARVVSHPTRRGCNRAKTSFGTFILTLTKFRTFVTYRSEAPVDRRTRDFREARPCQRSSRRPH